MVMVDLRGFQGIVAAVERLRDTVQSESNASLIVTRAIRETVKQQFSVINRLDRNLLALKKELQGVSKQSLQSSSVDIDGQKIGREIAKELRSKPLQVEIKQSFLGGIKQGLKEGLGIGISNQLVKGFDKSLKAKTGFNIQSLGFGSLTAVTNPRQAFKDAAATRRNFQVKQTANLPQEKLTERDILIDEEIERYRQEINQLKRTIKDSEKLAQKKNVAKTAHDKNLRNIEKTYKEYDIKVSDPDKPIVVVVGGFTGTGGTSSRAVRSGLNQVLGHEHAQIEEVYNAATDPDRKEFRKNLPDFIKEDPDLAPLQEAIEEGYYRGAITLKQFHTWVNHNADAVKVAAKVLSAKKQNPNAQIDLLGFSGGGYTVEEALAILQEMGITDVKGVGAGTPNLGIPYKNNPNYKRVLGTTDEFVNSPLAKLMEPNKTKQATTKNVPGFSNTTNHNFFDYIFNPEVIKGFSTNIGTKVIEKKIQDKLASLRKKVAQISESGEAGSDEKITNRIETDINKIQDYLSNFQDYLEDDINQISEQLEAFRNPEQLQNDFSINLEPEKISNEVEVSSNVVKTISEQISETIEKILLQSFNKALGQLLKQSNQPKQLSLSDKYLIYLNNQVQGARQSAGNKIRSIIPNYNDLTVQQKRQRGREFSSDIQQQVKQFRKAIQDQDKALARQLGEKVLKDVQAVKQVYQNLLQELPAGDSGTRSITALNANLTRIQNEVLKGDKGKGRSQIGLTQLVREAENTGDDTSQGFLQTIEESLAEVEASGVEFGESFLEGAKNSLGVASPSVEMINLAADVVQGFNQGLEQFGEEPRERVQQFVRDTDEQIKNWVDSIGDRFNQFKDSIAEKFPILGKFKNALVAIAVSFVVFKAITAAVGYLTQLGDASFDAVLNLESLQVAMLTLTGSSSKAQSGLAFVRSEADQLGIALETAEEAYSQLVATTRYTPLRGQQTDQLFSVFAKTFTLRGLSAQQQESAFRAINQSISKGKLGAEERRQQLGEIPALAFEQTTARALGVDVRNLDSLELDINEVLPKIAAQYAAENAAITQSTQTTQASINRFNNSILNLKRSMADWVKGSAVFFNGFAAGINLLTTLIPSLIELITLLALTLAFDQGFSLVKALLLSQTGTSLFQKALASLFGLIKSALPALLGFLKQFIIITAVVKLATTAIEAQRNSYQDLEKDIESATKRYNQLTLAIQNATKASQENNKNLPTRRRDVTLDETLEIFGLRTPFNLEPVRQIFSDLTGNRFVTRGTRRVYDLARTGQQRSEIVDQNLQQAPQVFQQIQAIQEIDRQLRLVTSRRASLGFNDNEEFNQLLEQEAKLLEQRDDLLKVTSQFSSNLEADQAIIQRYLEELDDLVATGNITGQDETAIREQLEARLTAIEDTRKEFEGLTSALEESVNSLERELRNLNEQATYFNETLERTSTNARVRFIRQALGEGLGESVIGLGQNELEQRNLEARRVFIGDQLDTIGQLLSDPEFAAVLQELRNQASNQGVNLNNTATIDRFLEQNRSQEETAVLNTLRQQLELQNQLGQTEEQLTNSILNQRNALFDLNRTIEDYFVNLFQQINETRVETERLLYQLRNNDLKTQLQRAIVPGSETFINNLVSQVQGLFDEAFGLAERYFGNQSGRIQFAGEQYSLNTQLVDFTRNVSGATEALEAFTQALGGRVNRQQQPVTNQQPTTGSNAVAGVIGYVGSTGRSTGPHLDIRGFTSSDRKTRIDRERLSELLNYFEAGGKPLKSYTLTSGYGNRTHPVTGQPSFHPAFDFGIPSGTPITFKGQAVKINQRPNLGAAGNTIEIALPTGEIIQLLHLSKFGDAVVEVVKTATPTARNTQSFGQNRNYGRLGELQQQLSQNPNFSPNTPKGRAALATALIIAAGESGSNWLKEGSGVDLFSGMGGAGNAMRGFAQFNTRYFNTQTDTPQEYINFLGQILTGQRALPTGKGKFYPQELAGLVESGTIDSEEKLLEYLQFHIPIMDWHGLHESGGGGQRIRQSGVLREALGFIRSGSGQDPIVTQATQGTQQLINQRASNLNLQDAALNQDIERFLLNLQQTRESIQRELDDGIRNSTNSVKDLADQLEDFRSRYSGQTLSSQAEADLRSLESEYRNFDNQLFEQERLLSDNIQGIEQFIQRSTEAQTVLRESGSPIDAAQANFLESLTPRLQQELTVYENYQQRIQSIREQLKAAKVDAENFITEQARLREIERELTTLNNEVQNAQQGYNFELEKTIALAESQLQLERDRIRINQDYADRPEERQRQLAIAQQQSDLRERDITLRVEEQRITRELGEVNRDLNNAQQQANLEKLKELELLRSQLETEQQILEIKRQYPDLAQQELEINKLREAQRLREIQIENDIRNRQLQRERGNRDLDSQIAENRAALTSDPFEAATIRQDNAAANERLRFQETINQIGSDTSLTATEREERLAKALEIHQQNLELIDRQYQGLGETITGTVVNSIGNFVSALTNGENAFEAFATSVLQGLSQIGQALIMNSIRGAFGISSVGFAGAFADGGTIREALRKEGSRGVLAVFTPGEEILSLRTGEAQRYQTLKNLLGNNPLKEINFYRDGGTVEGNLLNNLSVPTPQLNLSERPSNNSVTNNRNANITVNVSSPNVSSFAKSERQIGKMIREYIDR